MDRIEKRLFGELARVESDVPDPARLPGVLPRYFVDRYRPAVLGKRRASVLVRRGRHEAAMQWFDRNGY